MLAGHPVVGLVWLLAMCVNRWMMAGVVLWALEDEQAAKPTLIYPLRDLLGFAVWVGSYMGDKMQYHGGAYSLGVGGRFEPVAPKAKAGGANLPGGKLPDASVRGK
jgi:ceramide glucosyltransferase